MLANVSLPPASRVSHTSEKEAVVAANRSVEKPACSCQTDCRLVQKCTSREFIYRFLWNIDNSTMVKQNTSMVPQSIILNPSELT